MNNIMMNNNKHYDYLCPTSLAIISALMKELDTFQVALFVVSNILMYEKGQCCQLSWHIPRTVLCAPNVLAKLVDQFPGKPPLQLLIRWSL
ncbi:hypothetical protein Hanom_Chr03g00231801 [Helianthus anomalus]